MCCVPFCRFFFIRSRLESLALFQFVFVARKFVCGYECLMDFVVLLSNGFEKVIMNDVDWKLHHYNHGIRQYWANLIMLRWGYRTNYSVS